MNTFNIGDKVTYIPLPEGHEERLPEDERPKGVGVVTCTYGVIFPYTVDFPGDKGWPVLAEEIALVTE